MFLSNTKFISFILLSIICDINSAKITKITNSTPYYLTVSSKNHNQTLSIEPEEILNTDLQVSYKTYVEEDNKFDLKFPKNEISKISFIFEEFKDLSWRTNFHLTCSICFAIVGHSLEKLLYNNFKFCIQQYHAGGIVEYLPNNENKHVRRKNIFKEICDLAPEEIEKNISDLDIELDLCCDEAGENLLIKTRFKASLKCW